MKSHRAKRRSACSLALVSYSEVFAALAYKFPYLVNIMLQWNIKSEVDGYEARPHHMGAKETG